MHIVHTAHEKIRRDLKNRYSFMVNNKPYSGLVTR